MHIILCDDSKIFLDELENKITEIGKKDNFDIHIDKFTSSKEMLNTVRSNITDATLAFFLDIDMPLIDGFGVAVQLRKMNEKANIVFVSNKDELVFRSLEYHPFFFIRKGHLDEELESQLRSLNQIIHPKLTMIDFQIGHQTIQLPIEKICYVESERNYLLLYRKNDSKADAIRVRMKISTAEEQWKQYGFIRIHKGFLVNTHCVGDLFHNGIRMNDERIINIGRKHLLNVQENLLEAKSH